MTSASAVENKVLKVYIYGDWYVIYKPWFDKPIAVSFITRALNLPAAELRNEQKASRISKAKWISMTLQMFRCVLNKEQLYIQKSQ